MMSINPNVSILLNAVMGIYGVLESAGVINLLTTQGGKAGAVAATVIAATNIFLHGTSSAQPGPVSSDPAPRS